MFLFVYGTFRYGFELHHFLKDSRFVGLGHIEGYNMYDLGSYPGIVKGENSIWGEVYEVDEKLIKEFDIIEGYMGREDDLYVRETTTVFFDERRRFRLNDVYFYRYNMDINCRDLIESGNYSMWAGMPEIVNYFSYAENTNTKVIQGRGVNKILDEFPAVLNGYKMIFSVPCKYGFCANLVEDPEGKIYGYNVKTFLHELNSLDRAEQHMLKYKREIFEIRDMKGKLYYAMAYISDMKEEKNPSKEYIEIIKEGLKRGFGDGKISTGIEKYL
ncbi:gamma-glutamylcyclotransferase [Sulfuracidifex tepidarius]|uniref:Gamma-glutamylcyclotransferase n=1 Tax=Sulfuracidifex tepidarius TaxID=1294262 RepID=A0A510DRD8_9CREN|nr:gamma-glutamylcyclotransferase [Sulfuracidifex tepidarius]BBG22724.1 Putative gamma-glutamylcyclotransferase [Sulfuracidifex tepidarius]BBG25503.1 Putative gamma-glutamylcyclotransferase [Sulfuracidifex tepidarius]